MCVNWLKYAFSSKDLYINNRCKIIYHYKCAISTSLGLEVSYFDDDGILCRSFPKFFLRTAHTHMLASRHTHTYTDKHTHIHTRAHTHTLTHTYTDKHTLIHTHARTHTQTHTYTQTCTTHTSLWKVYPMKGVIREGSFFC